MAVSDDLKFKLIVAAVGVGVVIYASYKAKQAVGGALDSVGTAISNGVSEGVNFVANLPANTAQFVYQAYDRSAQLDAANGSTLADGNRAIFGFNDPGGTVAPYGSIGTAVSDWWNGLSSSSGTPVTPGNGAPQTDFGNYVSM